MSRRSSNWTVTPDQILTTDEVQRLYAALADARDLAIQRGRFLSHVRDFFILRTLLETGVRVFELISLKVGDFTGTALIVRKGKGGKKRAVLLTLETQKMIRQFLKTKKEILREPIGADDYLFLSERKKPYSTRGVRLRVKHWFKRCGLNPKFSCHTNRHSYISHLMASGADPATVRDNAGHASLATTSIYTHAIKKDMGDLDLYKSTDFNGSRKNKAEKKPKD